MAMAAGVLFFMANLPRDTGRHPMPRRGTQSIRQLRRAARYPHTYAVPAMGLWTVYSHSLGSQKTSQKASSAGIPCPVAVDQRTGAAGSPKRIQVRRTSASEVAALARRIASPTVVPGVPKAARRNSSKRIC
jgi:hypothetical protein